MEFSLGCFAEALSSPIQLGEEAHFKEGAFASKFSRFHTCKLIKSCFSVCEFHTILLKGQYHAIFSNTSKIGKTLFG